MKNLGTKIEKALKPTVLTIDSIWGTDLEHCTGCQRTKENLDRDSTLSGIAFAVYDRVKYELGKKGKT